MNRRGIAFGIGMVLAVLVLLTATAAADNVLRLEPSEVSCTSGEEVTNVWVLLNATDDVTAFQVHLKYEDDVVDIVNITKAEEGTNPNWVSWDAYWKVDPATGHHYLFITGSLWSSSVTGDNIEIGNITLKGLNPGTRPLEFDGWSPGHDPCQIVDITGKILNLSAVNGTFTCTAPQETYSKDLVEGWNLISLPLTADDMTVSSVFSSVSGKYDAIYSYDATTHSWVALGDDDTLENGVGYFIHMTESGTWTYNGSAYTTMNISLEPGLNMVGWLNCSKPIDDALSSIEGNYRYVARWNSTAHKFEVYVPGAPSEFNDFNTMERGEGYFISMKTSDTLTASC